MNYKALISSHIIEALPKKIVLNEETLVLTNPRVFVNEFNKNNGDDCPEGFDEGFVVWLIVTGKKHTFIKEDEDRYRVEVEDREITDKKVFSNNAPLKDIIECINEMVSKIATNAITEEKYEENTRP